MPAKLQLRGLVAVPAPPPPPPPPPPHGVALDSDRLRATLSAELANNTITSTLHAARCAAQAAVTTEPLGVACPVQAVAAVQAACHAGHSTMASGTLSQLALGECAQRTIDVGRLMQLLGSATTHAMRTSIGPITVNRDAWNSTTAENLHRCNKDAEVDALCLMRWWCGADPSILAELDNICADLVFEFKAWGSGSTLTSNKAKQIDDDENRRQTLGMSSWRLCLFFADYLGELVAEGRAPGEKTDAKRLVKVMTEDGVKVQRWTEETLTRYIGLSKRVDVPSIRSLLLLWESRHARAGLVDTITVLRAFVGVTSDDNELLCILRTAFLEQCAGLRNQIKSYTSNNDCRTPANVAKAVLIRHNLYIHLQKVFPKLEGFIKTFEIDAFVGRTYGVQADGHIDDSFVPDPDADGDGSDDDDAAGDTAKLKDSLTSYQSRVLLGKLLKQLAKNKLERSLCCMAKETTSKAHVDLTTPGAKHIAATIRTIQDCYVIDFPAAPPSAAQKTCVTHGLSSGATSTDVVMVQIAKDDDDIVDEAMYQALLQKWNDDVKAFEGHRILQYLLAHASFVVDDDGDVDKLKVKLMRLPVMHEQKRKLFQKEILNTHALDWPKLKKLRKSMFQPLCITLTSDDVQDLLDIYLTFRTEDADKESSDVVCAIVPGPLPNTPVNKNLEACYKASPLP